MNDDSFFATLKLTTGEEVLAEVMPEDGSDFFVIGNPIVINENTQVDPQKGIAVSGLIPKKWLLYANEDLSILYKQHIVSMSEMDKFGADFYQVINLSFNRITKYITWPLVL